MAEPFLGEIRPVSFPQVPQGWARCDGQLLLIALNPDLFALIGTTYGGDGITTFALPDLRARSPIHQNSKDGGNAGFSARALGDGGGAEAVTLTGEQIPAHSHPLKASGARASSKSATGNVDAYGGSYGRADASPTTMADAAIGQSGGGGPHTNMPPFLTISYIIALVGTNPTPPPG